MNNLENSLRIEKETTLAKAFAKHQSVVWKLGDDHIGFLEIAFFLFKSGMISVPLSSKSLRALVFLLEEEVRTNALLFLEKVAVEDLVWSNAWKEEVREKAPIPPFIISSLEGMHYLYPRKLFSLECKIADCLSELLNRSYETSPLENASKETLIAIELLKEELKIEQKRALQCSLTLPVTVITGGPGTGKSFTAARIIAAHQLLKNDLKEFCHVIVTAPTGKAVVELQKKFSLRDKNNSIVEFTTLHRLLKMTMQKKSLRKEPFLDASLILIDECSMIDMEMFSLLLEKLHPKTTLVLIGDPDQLPPVGSGDVFASLCSHIEKDKEFVSLFESVRFEREDLCKVASLCQKQDPLLKEHLSTMKSLSSIPSSYGGLERVQALYTLYHNWHAKTALFKATTPEEALKALSSATVLCSLQEGPWGAKMICQHFLKMALAKKALYIPILFTKNDETLQFQNGLQGILEIDPMELYSMEHSSLEHSSLERGSKKQDGAFSKTGKIPTGLIHYLTADGMKTLPSRLIDAIDLAFAISVHKSQGSEFEHVCLVLSPGSEHFGNSLLYTAFTRAKQSLHCFALEETLLKTLLFPSGNLSHLRDRLRLKSHCKEEAALNEKISVPTDNFALPSSHPC